MGGDSVVTSFSGDDSGFQAVAKRVMRSMAHPAGFKGPPATFNAATAVASATDGGTGPSLVP
jgi:hypothetical protein